MAKIYLSYNNQAESFELPVLPEEIQIKEDGNNKTYILQNIGEVSVLNTSKAFTLKLKGFLPVENGPYVTSKHLFDPMYYIEKIQKWRDSKKPIRLVVTGLAFDMSEAVSIESITYKESAGSVGDIEYEIELKEYRWFKVKKVEVVKAKNQVTGASKTVVAKTDRQVEKTTPKSYTVQSGDNLYAICKKQLGDGAKYKEVAKKNNISNPNLIHPGQVLKL